MVRCTSIDILSDFPRDSNTHTHTYKIIPQLWKYFPPPSIVVCNRNGKRIVDDGWKYVQKWIIMRDMIPKQNQFEKASRETNEQIEYKQENASSLSPGASPWSGYSVLYQLIYNHHVSIINKWIWDYASWVRRRPHVMSFSFPFILRFVLKKDSRIVLYPPTVGNCFFLLSRVLRKGER